MQDLSFIFDKIIDFRRKLHKIPEICFNEIKTSAFIKEELCKLKIPYKESLKTGIVAFINGKSNFTIAFRADMDGLAIKEETGLEYKSENDGYMHACGHDFHMAILLGIAYYYSLNKPECNILLIFQPAEEGGGGALKMISENIFEFYKRPDLIFGLHVNPQYNYDEVSFASGPAWAGSCEFEIKLNATGGHGAQPHTATDLLFVFSEFYTSIQALLSRKKNIQDPALLTIGKIKGFDIPNVFSKEAVIGGTFRFFSEKIYKFLNNSIIDLLESIKKIYDFSYLYKEISVYLPIINNENVSNNFEKIVTEKQEKSFKLMKSPVVMISDDFSYFLNEIPGIYFFLGVKSGEDQKLHTPDFNPDEKALKTGFELFKFIVDNYKDFL